MFFQGNVKKYLCEVPPRGGWSFTVTRDSRGMPVKYNVGDDNEEGLEEEDNVEDHQHDLENHKDHIDNEMMIKTDINDYDDMANTYNVQSRSYDKNDDLDGEDGKVH